MDIKITRHTSTNLEELDEKIARLLKDPADAIEQASINVDQMDMKQLKEFAENGGLGACVSKVDVLASGPDELMYLQGERIIVLKHVENDIYMGYCEGIIGNFNAENVHFVELDPRVLESLDADLEFVTDDSQYRDSTSSFGTFDHHQQQYGFRDSYSSTSENIPSWAMSNKKSFDSIGTYSTHSFQYHHQQSNISSISQQSDEDPYDTSAFNVDYSDDDEAAYTKKSATIPTYNLLSSLSNGNPPRSSNHTKLPVDEFGFTLTNKNQSRPNSSMNSKFMKEYRENELKWLSIMNKSDPASVKKDAKFKKLVRLGIPASVRSRVWQFLAGSNDYRRPNQFQVYANKPTIPVHSDIQHDLPLYYPNHIQFMDPEGQGQKELAMILKAYTHYNQRLEYCQGVGRVAGLLLMQMTVEDSFWLLVATIERYLEGYFTPSMSQLKMDAYIVGQLIKDHQPKLVQHLESYDIHPIMYLTQWFLNGFTTTLPWDAVLRLWDAFYFEGIKVFYRACLAIMDICKDHLLGLHGKSELLDFLLRIPHKYLESTHLLESTFKVNLSKTDVKKYAKKAVTEN